MKKVIILGAEVADVGPEEALDLVKGEIKYKGSLAPLRQGFGGLETTANYITTPNPEIVLAARKDKELRSIINHSFLALPDGFGLKIAAWLLWQRLENRIAGADFMMDVCGLAEKEGWPVFLLGGGGLSLRGRLPSVDGRSNPDASTINTGIASVAPQGAGLPGNDTTASKAAERLRRLYPDIKIVGAESGGKILYKGHLAPLRQGFGGLETTKGEWVASNEDIIDKINQSGAKVLFVGFGCPKQEKWLRDNLNKLTTVKLAMTVGGTYDYLAGRIRRAPSWLRRLGLEWLWRLVHEPRRLGRIWNATARFVWQAIKWRLRMRFVYRPSAVGFILNNQNKVLIVRRAFEDIDEWKIPAEPEHWQLPQGGVEPGESEEAAVLREMQEEVGLSDLEIIGRHPKKYRYDWLFTTRLRQGRRGQKQTIFYLRWRGDDNAVALEADELDDYQWVDIDKAVDSVHSIRQPMTKMAVEGFIMSLRGSPDVHRDDRSNLIIAIKIIRRMTIFNALIRLLRFGRQRRPALATIGLSMTKNNNKVRVRFAPSPTGAPHVGNIRTALFNWLFAKHHGGAFIVRIEDTDQSRIVPRSLEQILESLDWLGLTADEGVRISKKEKVKSDKGIEEIGDKGPYFQSKRLDIYREHAEKLAAEGNAYYCFCFEERLAKLREEQAARHEPPKYDRHCLSLSPDEVKNKLASGEPRVIRLKVPSKGQTKFTDIIKGEVAFQNSTIDDQVLLKSDGYPTYHLASVVDDYLMGITHVIRAEEWLPSTPKHVILYDCFGWPKPQFAHLPVILGPDKSKLSKRHGAVSALDYRTEGYLADALVNYLALLGWNPKTEQEIFTRQELIAQFNLAKVNKANPIFDIVKLNWMNREYIKKMGAGELAEAVLSLRGAEGDEAIPTVSDAIASAAEFTLSEANLLPRNDIKKALKLAQDRMEKLTDFDKITEFLWKENLEYEAALLVPKTGSKTQTKTYLQTFLGLAQGIDEGDWEEEQLREIFLNYCDKNNIKRGEFLWPARVAATGLKDSPDLFAVMDVLGKERSIKRIEEGMKKL